MSNNTIMIFFVFIFVNVVDVYCSSSCTELVLFSHVVVVWHSNTQPCLQSVDFVL